MLCLRGNGAKVKSELIYRTSFDTDYMSAYLNEKSVKISQRENLPHELNIILKPRVLYEERNKGEQDIIITSIQAFMNADDIIIPDQDTPEQFRRLVEATADGNTKSNRINGAVMDQLINRYAYHSQTIMDMINDPSIAVRKGPGYKVPKNVLEDLLNECSPRIDRVNDGHAYITYFINPILLISEMMMWRMPGGEIDRPAVDIIWTRRKTTDDSCLEYTIDVTNGTGVDGDGNIINYDRSKKLDIDLDAAARLII